MLVVLSELDTYKIAWAAHDRCSFKEKNNIKHKRIDDKRDNYQITREGLTGEWAVGSALDLPVNLDLYLGTDEGFDFNYRGYTIDVKTTRAKYLLFQSLEKFSADVAILAKYHNEYHVELMGAISKKKFKNVHQIVNFGYQNNTAVQADQLTPIEEFIHYVNRYPKN